MKIGCAAYSFRQYLTSGEMSLEGFLEKAVEMDVDGVELTAYYFPSTDDAYLHTLKRQCYLLGLQVSAAAVGNRFTDPDPGERAAQVEYVKDWVDVSVKLGAPCLRVFAGGTPEGHSEAEARQWTIDGLKECANTLHRVVSCWRWKSRRDNVYSRSGYRSDYVGRLGVGRREFGHR